MNTDYPTISFAAFISPVNFGIACSWPMTSLFKFFNQFK